MCQCDDGPDPLPVPTEAEITAMHDFYTRRPPVRALDAGRRGPLTPHEQAEWDARLLHAFGPLPEPPVAADAVGEVPDGEC